MIAVIGYHTTKFGELWNKSLYDLVSEVANGVCKEVDIEPQKLSAIFYGNMLGGVLENNLHGGAKIAELLKVNIPVYRAESACASGGIAFQHAYHYLEAHTGTVLVVGAEKMTDSPVDEVVSALSSASSGEEQEAGLTFPGLYGMLAQQYLAEYEYSEENLAAISVKNHYHGTKNQHAQFQKELSIEDIMKSPYVATPLKVLDSSPISDGASAVIVTSDPAIIQKAKAYVSVLASESATDSISLSGRRNLTGIYATEVAGKNAFATAGITHKDISVAEVHDCFSIAEIMAMEDLGFWERGSGGAWALEYATKLGNTDKLVVNTSGGLKSAGHPVGATGVKQIGEVFLQLTQQATDRQVKAQYGLTHNVGGSGGTAVVSIFGV